MNNEFTIGFKKTAGITTMGKIVRIGKRFIPKAPLTQFPKATPHPATVNLAKKFRGKERLMDKMRKNIGDKRFEEIVKMKKAKDIANYNSKKVPTRTIGQSGKYQGTTHDYNKYRQEFKDKALAERGTKF